jgi:hypothetical protein
MGWQDDPIIGPADAGPPPLAGHPSITIGGPAAQRWQDDPVVDSPQPSLGRTAAQIPAGFNETLANVAGAPVDFANWLLHRSQAGIPSPLGPAPDAPFMGSNFIKRNILGAAGINPEDQPAVTAPERIARGAGGGIAGMMLPGMSLADLGIGAAAGAVGKGAAEIVPEPWKPSAEMAGNMAGGLGALGVAAGGRAAGNLAGTAARYPLATQGAIEREATQRFAGAAENPGAVAAAIDEGAGAPLVPGSRPTTFQATGDMGIGALERAAATKDPVPFQDRRAEQNTARLDAIGKVQPTGSPEQVPKLLRAQLEEIDRSTQTALDQATTAAQGRTTALGGTTTPEASGNAMRTALQDAENTARQRERGLWAAVDPDGTLALQASPVRASARSIASRMADAAKPMEGEEAAIFSAAKGFKDVMPFSELTALRSRVSTAMRDELRTSGQTPAYARLTQLRGAIEDTIADGVHSRAAQEAQAVAAGTMRPEDTIAANLQAWRDGWYAQQAEAGALNSASAGGNAGTRSVAFPGARGTAGQARGSVGYAPGAEGLSRDVPLTPNFDEAARERLSAASAATKQRAQTFGQGPVGQTLKTQGQQGNYRLSDASVPAKFFRPGPTGAEGVQAFRQAIGNDGQALAMLRDHIASDLVRTARRQDGTLDPARFATWQRSHQDALRAFPDLQQRFGDAARATEAIGEAAALRKQAIDQYQAGIVGKLLKVDDPQDVTRTVGGIFGRADSMQQMRRLAVEAKKDPNAFTGLRKAVADYITGRFVSNTEVGTSGQAGLKADQFQTFIRQNVRALAQVLKPEEIKSLGAIAADLQRANRSLTAVKIPGQSNTAQDTLAAGANGAPSILSRMLLSGAGATAGFAGGGPVGSAIGAFVAPLFASLREAGLQKVDDLVREALLDPTTARILLSNAPASNQNPAKALAMRLRRLSVMSGVQQTGRQ